MARSAKFTDNFNRENASTLGSNWQTLISTGYDIGILSNSARCSANGAQNRAAVASTNIPVKHSPDQYAQLTISSIASPYGGHGLLLRAAFVGGVTTGLYEVNLATPPSYSGQAWFRKRVASVWSEVGWQGDATTWAVGDVMLFEAVGSTLSIYRNGNLFSSWSDFSLDGNGNNADGTSPGISLDPMGNYGSRVDDFESGEIVPDGPSNAAFYVRKSGAWVGPLTGYVRAGGAWVAISGTPQQRRSGAWA